MQWAFAVLFGIVASAALAQRGAPLPPPVQPSGPPASEADRPRIAPSADWVKAATLPAPPPQAGQAAIVMLLSDQQVRLLDGGGEAYVAVAYKINSSQALAAAALGIAWDPAMGGVTIHHYRLIREGKPIDLLGDGSKLVVVRREPNLERATLDGHLTATLQPENVRVGDIVEFAYTARARDPALAGRMESLHGWGSGVPIGRARLRVLSPVELTRKEYPGAPAVSVQRTADGYEYVADATNYSPPRPPRNAPPRARLANLVEFTNARSWAEVAASARPLYTTRAVITPGSPLAAEIARIKAASPDQKKRAELALSVVQQQVRYVLLALNGGGYTPAPAELTWQRRFGDCKGKTVLLLAMLNALGIEAEPVLVNTEAGDATGSQLPRMQSFDHVLVRARIGGRSYWLDGTRPDDTDLDRIDPPSFRYALPLVAGAKLEPVEPFQPQHPLVTQTLDLDARDGLTVPAKASAEMRLEGPAATAWRVTLKQLSPADRDRALREFWRREYSFVEPQTVAASEEPHTGAMILSARGTARMGWGEDRPVRYEADGASIGFRLDTTRDEELGKDAPFEVSYPNWTEYRQTILLPHGGKGFRLSGGVLDETHGPWVFKRSVKLDGERFTLSSTVRSTASEMAAAVARTEEPKFRELAKSTVWVDAPASYPLTAADTAALKAEPAPQTAKAYVDRATKLFDANQPEAAQADLEAALKLEPDNAAALAKLGVRLIETGNVERGRPLVERALAADPKQPDALAQRALLAERETRYADAERDYTSALETWPNWRFALVRRAYVRARIGKADLAMQDVESLERETIKPAEAAQLRVRIALTGRTNEDEQARALARLVDSRPDDLLIRRERAQFLLRTKLKPVARQDYDLLIAKEPSADLYIERAQTWDAAAEQARWRADLSEAAKLQPKSGRIPMTRAAIELRLKNYDAAAKAADEGHALQPDDLELALTRLTILRNAKKLTQEQQLTETEAIVRAHPDNAMLHNNLCWARATHNLQLEAARANCETALKLAPRAASYLDSRGLLNYRLRDYKAALADYDRALSIVSDLPASLYGRGLAKAALGDKPGAAADFAAARKASPGIDEYFGGFGLAAPDAPKAAATKTAAAAAAPAITGELSRANQP